METMPRARGLYQDAMLRKNIFWMPVLTMLAVLTALAGCRQGQDIEIPFLPGFGPHKIDIPQGNIVTQEMVEKLQAGMTRNQVRFVLGTPLLVDPFRNDRWDYLYLLNQRGSLVEQRQLKVYFKDDRLVRYEGDLPVNKALTNATGKPPAGTPAQPLVGPPGLPALEKPAMGAPPAAPAAVAPAAPAPPLGDPQLRLSPSEGQPATAEERAAAAAAAPAPAGPAAPQPLEAPPLPRIQLPPEQPETPARSDPAPPAKP